jgi:hypothetical protein
VSRAAFLAAGLLVGATLGFGAQQLRLGARAEATPAAEPEAAGTASPVVASVTSPESPAVLLALGALDRRLDRIEQKLGGAAPAAEPRRTADEAPLASGAKPDERTSDQQRGFDRAEAIVAGAIRAGVWADADQKAMRDTIASLAPADVIALRVRLSMAGNAGQLRDVAAEPMFF